MTTLTKAIRNKRFVLVDESPVQLLIETMTGNRHKFKLTNCSLTGLGAVSLDDEASHSIEKILAETDIVPSTKLHWEGHEYSLGRMIIRNVKKTKEGLLVGFSTVDSKIPLDGHLSQFLKATNSKNNPFEFELSPDKFSLANFTENQETNVDLFGKTRQFSIFYNEWKKTPKFQYYTVREPSQGSRVQLSKIRKGNRKDYLIMGSNDYLGLAAHPEVAEAAKKAIDKYGFGSTGSPLTTGITTEHEILCDTLSRIFKKERTILFNSGYVSNVGTIQGLTGGQDLVIADILSHASIQDGMAMARSTSRFFKHDNYQHLEKVLTENRSEYSGCLLITEGVFSMDGDVPNLNKFIELSKRFNARSFVDEAHSFGVVGEKGLGTCHQQNVIEDTDIIMGTFSKIAGGIGGFISTDKDVAEWLYMFARAHMFSVSIPPSTAAAANKALQLFLEDESLVKNLQRNIKHFSKGLREMGYPIGENHESAVIPVVIGDEEKLGAMNEYLQDRGVFVVPIVYPAVSRKASRFRFTVTATHNISDLDYVLNIFEQAAKLAKVEWTLSDSEILDLKTLKTLKTSAA